MKAYTGLKCQLCTDGPAVRLPRLTKHSKQVLSGENWNTTMYSARRAVGWVSVLYFVSLIVFGMMIVMSLFLAILISHFSTPPEKGPEAERQEQQQQQQQQQQSRRPRQGVIGADRAKHAEEQDRRRRRRRRRKQGGEEESIPVHGINGEKISNTSQLEESIGEFELYSDDSDDGCPVAAASRALSRASSAALGAPWSSVGGGSLDYDNHDDGMLTAEAAAKERREEEDEEESAGVGGGSAGVAHADTNGTAGTGGTATAERDKRRAGAGGGLLGCRLCGKIAGCWSGALRSVSVPEHMYPGLALCCLSAKNPLRRGCAAVVSNAGFDRFVLLLIVVSSIILAVDSPLRDPDSEAGRALHAVELATAGVFAVEFLLKVCASGFYFMPMSYLRDPWNALDFVVVVVSVSQLFLVGDPRLAGLRSVRALRALRPLR